MKKHACFGFLLVFLPVLAIGASSLPEDLIIKQLRDSPAGCLPNDYGKNIKLEEAYVAVIDKALQGSKSIIWSLESLPSTKPITLKPGECLIAGAPVNTYKQEGVAEWKLGASYVFFLKRRDKPGLRIWGLSRPNWVYRGVFCVAGSADHKLMFLPYVDHPDDTTTYPICARHRSEGRPSPDGIVPPP